MRYNEKKQDIDGKGKEQETLERLASYGFSLSAVLSFTLASHLRCTAHLLLSIVVVVDNWDDGKDDDALPTA